MSTGRANLSINGRSTDAQWFGGGEHIFDYQDWMKTENHIPEVFDIDTTTVSPTYGSELSFELDKRGDLLGEIQLLITRSLVTEAGGSVASYFLDHEGYSSIDVIRFWYENKVRLVNC